MRAYQFPDYSVTGAGDTTVFLMHGAYGSKDYFRHEIKALVKAGLRVVAWDAPGYGLSPLPADLSIEGLADTAALWIDKLATRTNVLMGHSMGGIVAPAVCNRLPQKIHGLVVSATVASFSEKSEADKKTFLAERIEPLKRGNSFYDTAGAVLDSMFHPESSGEAVDLVKRVALTTRMETFVAAIEAIVRYEGVPALRAVKQPTLLVAGGVDKVGQPDAMRKMTQWLTDSQFVCIEKAGHYPFAEQQDVFNTHLLAFIEKRVLPASIAAKT